jgi:TRAP-type C4-dicarboxylate transport system permease small subunit
MINKVESALLLALETICIVLLTLLAGAVIYSTAMRSFGASPSWYDEIASVLLAWLTYFAATYAVFRRQHMGFAGLVTALPKSLAIGLTLLSELLVLTYFAVVAWYGNAILAVAKWDSLLSLPWMSLDIVQSVIPVTAVLMIVGTLMTMPRTLRDAASGVDPDEEEIKHAIAEAEKDAAVIELERNIR